MSVKCVSFLIVIDLQACIALLFCSSRDCKETDMERPAGEGCRQPIPPKGSSPSRSEARRLLKTSADDLVFLQNRIKKLEREEEVSLRRLRETQHRTEQISQERQRNAEKRSTAQAMQGALSKNQLREKSLMSLSRQRDRDAIASGKARVVLERKERVLAVKKQETLCESYVLAMKETDRERRHAQKEAIRAQQQRWRQERADLQRMAHGEKIRTETDQLLQQRGEYVTAASALVAKEAALLQHLAKLRNDNTTALSELSSLVGTPRACIVEGQADAESTSPMCDARLPVITPKRQQPATAR